jgi:uncharacterized protein (DUF58 family)
VIADTRFKYPSAIAMPSIAFVLGVGWLISQLTAHGGLARLCLMLLAVIATARAWSYVSLWNVRCCRQLDRVRLFPGETTRLTVHCDNAKLLPVWLRVQIPAGPALRATPEQHCGLSAYERRTLLFHFTALQRGVCDLGPTQLEAADPLGFYPRARAIPGRP